MAQCIQGHVSWTSWPNGLAAPARQSSAKTAIFDNFGHLWRQLTAELTTSGRTPAELAWDGLPNIWNTCGYATYTRRTKNTPRNGHFWDALTLSPLKGWKEAGHCLKRLQVVVRAGHCCFIDTFRFLLAPPEGPQGPTHQDMVKTTLRCSNVSATAVWSQTPPLNIVFIIKNDINL